MTTEGAMDTTAMNLLDVPDHIIVENILAELIPTSLSGDELNAKDLRDILSFASTCTRIHALASHPSLWRSVNAIVFSENFTVAIQRGVEPPPLPLGAVHCRVISNAHGCGSLDEATIALMEQLPEFTDVNVVDFGSLAVGAGDRIVRAVSSLSQLRRLELSGAAVNAFTGVTLPLLSRTLERLHFSCGHGKDVVGFLSANSFPSLTSIDASLYDGVFPAIVETVIRSCSALIVATIRGHVTGRDVTTLANGCRSLRSITVEPTTDLTAEDVPSSVSFPNIRELEVWSWNDRVSGSFLSLFPNVVRLELRGTPTEAFGDLRAVGGLMNLEHLAVDGCEFVGDACRSLLPLVDHPMTNGRRSLKSLCLCNCDPGYFLSSPWCSHIVDVTLENCILHNSESERFAYGKAISSTLRSLTLRVSEVDGKSLCRFVGSLSSIELTVTLPGCHFAVNGYIRTTAAFRGGGTRNSALSSFHRELPCAGDRIDVALVLHAIREAAGVTPIGNIDQPVVDCIASSCSFLSRFKPTTQ